MESLSEDRAAPEPVSKPARRWSPARVGVLCLWAAVFVAGAAGGAYRFATAYRRFANATLNDNIRYIEFRPDPAAAAVRLTRTSDIDAIRTWLKTAGRSPPAGATVRLAECPMAIVFGDGTTENLQIGRTTPEPGGARAAVEIRWRGYTRYADERVIAGLTRADP
jgi:hypothetical protein